MSEYDTVSVFVPRLSIRFCTATDEPLPTAFLDDVYGTTTPVIWAYDNIWQLTARYPNFSSVYGWNWSGFDFSSVAEVDYPLPPSTRTTQKLKRYAANAAGIMNYTSLSAGVTVLANCVRSDGSTFPWALRSTGPNGGSITYIGENPLVYITEGFRAALTNEHHMHLYVIYPVIIGLGAFFLNRGIAGFKKRTIS